MGFGFRRNSTDDMSLEGASTWFLECYNLLKRAIRCDSSSELVFGYEVTLGKKKFCTINVKSRRIRAVSGLRGKQIFNHFTGKVDSKDSMEIGNSCNGLILVLYSKKHVLFNPLSGRIAFATRKLPEWHGSRCCGFFYHPLAREYRLLHMTQIGNNSYEYHIYEFGAHKWRTIPTPKFSHYYAPISTAQLVVTKEAMFWWEFCCFTVFDINTEKLCLKRSPPLGHDADRKMVVATGGEDLCCCYVRYAETVVDVWVLVDYTNWLWEKKYAVNFDWEKNRCPSQAWSAHIPRLTRTTKVVSILGNILVLDFEGGGQLHCHDLVSNASWIVDTSKFNGKTQTTWYGRRRSVEKQFSWYRLLGL
ncbi:F-box and associated interaction domains-containing protein [Striga asiatica]|uniref:F-box and associated interaction domains-containing protein n=1 Tax=Striga asiatica TaxID=4170 RepID=A0A5A7Q4L5_STRAF|nr:F-box and associated interaction domains-containing protein [Striga asiatica]